MKFFYREGRWLEDRRSGNQAFRKNKRQIDIIKESLPCTVSEAFAIIGLFFETHFKRKLIWNKALKGEVLFDEVQRISNSNNLDLFILCFDDDSPVLFRGTTVVLFEDEEELDFAQELIMKKIVRFGLNVSLKQYKFRPN